MIYIYVRGGFANLYFQLAFASHLSSLTGREVTVFGNRLHPVLSKLYNSFCYDHPNRPSNFGEKLLFLMNKIPFSLIRIFSKFEFFSRKCIFFDPENPSESLDIMEKIILIDRNIDIYLYGYWQNFPASFYQKDLVDFKKILLEKVSSKSNDIDHNYRLAIHVRLGDYSKILNRIRFRAIDDRYYFKWISYFAKNFGVCSLDVYTDDENNQRLIRLVRKAQIVFPEMKIMILASNDLVTDLVALTDYKYRIIGNSTYGALAGYLSIPGMTITPQKWYNFRKTVIALPSCIYSLD